MADISEKQAKEIIQARIQDQSTPEPTGEIKDVHKEDAPIKSLGKSQMIQDRKDHKQEIRNMAGEIGWKQLPVENLPSRGLFYPPNTQITIRAASVQEIRHFSTIEEEDLIDIDDKLNFVVDKCVRVRFGSRMASFKDILEVDRFSLIFAIRELTFKDGENKLQMNITCNQCGHSDLIEIHKNNFNFFTLHDDLQRFYRPDQRCITLKEKNGSTITIHIPTLGVTNFIKNLVRTKSQRNEYYDKAFLKVAPFLFGDHAILNEKKYNEMNQTTFEWDVKKMSIVVKVIDLLQESINPEIANICTSCGSEVSAPINFQGGIKSLFLITTNIFADLD